MTCVCYRRLGFQNSLSFALPYEQAVFPFRYFPSSFLFSSSSLLFSFPRRPLPAKGPPVLGPPTCEADAALRGERHLQKHTTPWLTQSRNFKKMTAASAHLNHHGNQPTVIYLHSMPSASLCALRFFPHKVGKTACLGIFRPQKHEA